MKFIKDYAAIDNPLKYREWEQEQIETKLEPLRLQRTTEDYLMELQMAERAGRNPALAAMIGGPPGGQPDVLGGIGQQLARGEVLI